MLERERMHGDDDEGSGGGGSPQPDGNLERLRQEGESYLSASEAAINRALSGNSEAFLAGTRQRGGQ